MFKKLKEKFFKKNEKSEAEKDTEYLWKDKLTTLLWKQSLPAVIGQLVMALYNVVDTLFVKETNGLDGISALSVVFPSYLIISSFALAIGMGASSILSRCLWAKEFEKLNKVFGVSQFTIFVSTIIIVVCGLLFKDQLLTLFWTPVEIRDLTETYYSIVVFGQIFGSFMFANTTIIRSVGDTKIVMLVNILSAIVNIILDWFLMIHLNRGIEGAAWATVISWIFACLMIVVYFFRQKIISISFRYFKFHWEYMKEIFLLGMPTFFRQVIGSVVIIIVNNLLNIHGGKDAIGLLGIAQKVLNFFIMPLFWVIQGTAPILWYNYGARLHHRVKGTFVLATKVLTLYGVIISLIYFIDHSFLLSFFTETEEELLQAWYPTFLCMSTFCIIGVQMLVARYYQSLGIYKKAFVLSLMRNLIVFLPLLFILSYYFKLDGIWWAFPLSDLLSLVITFLIFRKDWIHLKKQAAELW